MKNLFLIFTLSVISGAIFNSCRKADPVIRKQESNLSDIYLTMAGKGSERLFDGYYSPNKDTIYFDVPWFYPVNSNNEVDIKNLIIRSTIPTDAVMSPALGTVTDLSNPLKVTITAGDGTQTSYVIVAKKVGDLSVSGAKVTVDNNSATEVIDGVVQDNEILIYVLPGVDLSAVKFEYSINPHSTGSIASGTTINLSTDVPFTVKGIDGVSKTYTLKAKEPVKLAYGFGINRKLWAKTGAELGFTANNEVCLAVSGDHLILTRRTNPSVYAVFDRFTGAYLQNMYYPFPGISFQLVNDTTGHLLACSWAPKNAKFIVYKYTNATDASPLKLIEWTNNNPTGITLDGGVGRRVNVYGDLNKDAVIMAPAGQSNVLYKWVITSGVLKSNTPDVIVYQSVLGGSSTKMGYYAEAQPISADPNSNYFINYQYEVAMVNGTTHQRIAGLTYGWPVVFTMPTSYIEYNHAKYLAIVKYINTYDLNTIQTSLFDVTSPANISMNPSDANYPAFNVFNSDVFTGTTNGNGTADICYGYSNNGERMQVYTLLTNGGITAHEFTNYSK